MLIEFTCSVCGNDLVSRKADSLWGDGIYAKIVPCATCLKKAREEALSKVRAVLDGIAPPDSEDEG